MAEQEVVEEEVAGVAEEVVEEVEAEESAPATEETDAPEVEGSEESQEEKEPSKTFTQEELDAIVSKRLAREQRKLKREQEMAAQQPPAAQVYDGVDDIKREYFATEDEYIDAVADRKAEIRFAEREAAQMEASVIYAFQDREEDAREKYNDYDEVAYTAPISDVMADAIRLADKGPDIAYHLGKDHKEASRIAALTPLQQAIEIGKLEAGLQAPQKKQTSAPAPIDPVGANKGGTVKDPGKMSDAEYDAWRAERKKKHGY
ncbi:hypothetical protein [Sulfurovum sp.]|uniref:hypothetical protein n=1 Tax=Sulfurovum sp. TaxID=1969726 RepID=UPI003562B9AE